MLPTRQSVDWVERRAFLVARCRSFFSVHDNVVSRVTVLCPIVIEFAVPSECFEEVFDEESSLLFALFRVLLGLFWYDVVVVEIRVDIYHSSVLFSAVSVPSVMGVCREVNEMFP